jgi:SprT protein
VLNTGSSATTLPRVVKAVRTRAPAVPRDMQVRALETTAKYIRMARQLFGQAFPMPDVAFDLRGRTAGQAFLGKNLIRLNAVLLMENEKEFHEGTIPHEVAHHVADIVYGRNISAHGPEWRSVMVKFGIAPRRCHSYDVSNSVVGGTHRYVCGCKKVHNLGARKHKQAAAGRLICKICRKTLRPEHANGVQTSPTPPMSRPVSVRTPPRVTLPTPSFTGSVPAPAVRPATPAMQQFALVLANRLGIALLPEHVGSFEQCSAFIDKHKVLTKPVTGTQEPSARQLDYAYSIANRKGLLIPPDVLADGRKISNWISQNK